MNHRRNEEQILLQHRNNKFSEYPFVWFFLKRIEKKRKHIKQNIWKIYILQA